MLSIEEIKHRLKDSNLTSVAKSSGVNYHTLYKFMVKNIDPRHSTVTLLSAYLMSLDGKENG
jgi:hypothetical protein